MTIDFIKLNGVVPAIVQDHESGRVLMLGFMNEEAFQRTIDSGFATFFSRSRQKLWLKGESSGHRLAVKEMFLDCDEDTVLLKVEMHGPGVCHAGYESCFYRKLQNGAWIKSEASTYDAGQVYGGAQ